jgi:hypothetical protein
MRSAMLRTLHAKVREGGRGTWDHLLLGLVYVPEWGSVMVLVRCVALA